MEALLTSGADVNAKLGSTGITALHIAAMNGHCDAVFELLASGADAAARVEPTQETALMLAARGGHARIVEALLAAGPSELLDAVNRKGRTALHIAAASEQVDVIESLLYANADLTIEDDTEKTPLQLARAAGGLESVLQLERALETRVRRLSVTLIGSDADTRAAAAPQDAELSAPCDAESVASSDADAKECSSDSGVADAGTVATVEQEAVGQDSSMECDAPVPAAPAAEDREIDPPPPTPAQEPPETKDVQSSEGSSLVVEAENDETDSRVVGESEIDPPPPTLTQQPPEINDAQASEGSSSVTEAENVETDSHADSASIWCRKALSYSGALLAVALVVATVIVQWQSESGPGAYESIDL